MRLRTIPLAAITRDRGLQQRAVAELNEEVVETYRAKYEAGEKLPPITVFRDREGKIWLADGHHRFVAIQRAGFATTEVEERFGDYSDAVAFAAGVNDANGYHRTAADKRRSVEMLLVHRDWKGRSNVEIARQAKVSESLVRSVKKSFFAANEDDGSENEESSEIQVTRNGKTFPMKTENIGKRNGKKTPRSKFHNFPGKEGKAPPSEDRLLLDQLGVPWPDGMEAVHVLRSEMERTLSKCRLLHQEYSRMSQLPGGELLAERMNHWFRNRPGKMVIFHELPSLQELIADTKNVMPYTRCPYCQHGGEVLASCKHCAGRNWVTQAIFDAAPPEVQSTVLELKHEDTELVKAGEAQANEHG